MELVLVIPSIATAMQDQMESIRKTMGRQRLKANPLTPRCLQDIEGRISEQAMTLICNEYEKAAAAIRGQKGLPTCGQY